MRCWRFLTANPITRKKQFRRCPLQHHHSLLNVQSHTKEFKSFTPGLLEVVSLPWVLHGPQFHILHCPPNCFKWNPSVSACAARLTRAPNLKYYRLVSTKSNRTPGPHHTMSLPPHMSHGFVKRNTRLTPCCLIQLTYCDPCSRTSFRLGGKKIHLVLSSLCSVRVLNDPAQVHLRLRPKGLILRISVSNMSHKNTDSSMPPR